jgi:D-glycero-alpha-D-manno-heptose 1-phosphate guanylyltransferase
MQNFDRYGAVTIDEQNIITSFNEKKFYNEGLINGGIYILNKNNFLSYTFPEVFSFEKEFLEVEITNKKIAGVIQQGYFIDIGIPEDYQLAQTDLQQPALDLKNITKEWTLFLDRDGVINEDKPGSYIFTPEEFVFTQGMPEVFKKLSDTFKYIIFVTNQRGVGKELMTETTLKDIHEKMISGITQTGGHVDAIYYCTSVLNTAPDRKPNPGMIAKAAARFDDIDLTKAIMVGNNPSDMLLGRNAGIYTVFVKTTLPDMQLPHPDIDILFDSLSDFAKAL